MTLKFLILLVIVFALLGFFQSQAQIQERQINTDRKHRISTVNVVENFNEHKRTVPYFNYSDVNANPGVKVTLTQAALSYILKETLPLLRDMLTKIHIDDINQSVNTPIGHVDISLSSIKVGTASLGDASLQISNSGLNAAITNVHLAASGNWHYRQHSFPHISDHGSVDVNIGMSVLNIATSASLNSGYKSGLKVSVDSIDFSFSNFDIKLHGGASWLYNIIVSLLKGDIEKAVHKAVAEGIPPAVTDTIQKSLDEQKLEVPISSGVVLSFAPRMVSFVNQERVTLGAAGDFVKDGVPPFLDDPASTPDLINSKMVQVYLTDHILSSAGFTFDKGGLMQTLVTPHDIPESWPISLNTSYIAFKLAAPGLYSKYPDRAMNILFKADETITPSARMSESQGVNVFAQGDAVFKVIQSDGSTIDAFTLMLRLNLTLSVAVKENIISGEVSLKNLTLGVINSQVGDISVSLLDTSLNFLVSNIIIPILNTFTEKGFPIPQLEQFSLIDPQIVVKDRHIQVYSDFKLKL